jgi:regulator of sirC expression with transglutaminase-like and TPR domain
MKIPRLLVLFVAMAVFCSSSLALSDPDYQRRVEKLFDTEYDLLDVKVAVDAMVDSDIDTASVKSEIDRMAGEIASYIGNTNKSSDKLLALRRYLYDSGSWNEWRPFRYDLDDPLGQKTENRLLQNYLDTRRGNCVTMPILFAILGQRLGLRMTLAEAPLHIFVKYTDDQGKTWNIEATSGGGFTRDVWYRQKLPMSDKAVTLGTYLRSLSDGETKALVASLLLEDQLAQGSFEKAVAISDVLLRHYPKFAYGFVKKGNAYSGLIRQNVTGKYRSYEDVPSEIKAQIAEWYISNKTAFAKAEALGWTPTDGLVDQ